MLFQPLYSVFSTFTTALAYDVQSTVEINNNAVRNMRSPLNDGHHSVDDAVKLKVLDFF
jgi:hypothetical protein